jgi:TRAP-type C4-dicarboxylate transport system permease small subunit
MSLSILTHILKYLVVTLSILMLGVIILNVVMLRIVAA